MLSVQLKEIQFNIIKFYRTGNGVVYSSCDQHHNPEADLFVRVHGGFLHNL